AANGSNSPEDLQSIQNEIDQRLGEINRVSEQTQFNGVKVLAEDRTMTIQVGAHDGQTISIGLQQIDANTLKLGSFSVSGISGPLSQLVDTNTTPGTTTIVELKVDDLETAFGEGKFTVHGVGEANADGT